MNNNKFHIALPARWTDQTSHYYMGPDDSGVRHTLTLTIDRYLDTDDLREYAGDRMAQIQERMPHAEFVKQETINLPDGTEAYEAVYKQAGSDGNATFWKLVFLIRNSVAYNFRANFSRKTINTIGIEVDRIIASLVPQENV